MAANEKNAAHKKSKCRKSPDPDFFFFSMAYRRWAPSWLNPIYIYVYTYIQETQLLLVDSFSRPPPLFVFFRKTIRKWKFFFYYCKKFSFSFGRVFKIEVDNRNPNVFPLNVFDHIWLGNRITLIFDAIVVVTMWQWTNKGGYKEEERMNTMRQRCLCVSI